MTAPGAKGGRMMSAELQEDYDDIAQRVASILVRRLDDSGLSVAKLLNVVFLTREEVAELLRVKLGTIDKWLKEGWLPARYANGHNQSEPRFLLSEIISWTLPSNDHHSAYRLKTLPALKLSAGNQLTAVRKEKR